MLPPFKPGVFTLGFFISNQQIMRKYIVIKKPTFKFKVNIWEFERGWGSKVDHVREFNTYDEAIRFIDVFNADNIETVVPDWYMVAKPDNFTIQDVQNQAQR